MKEPRPRITSARPPETASRVEKRSKTRTGSSELSTVTADPSRMRARLPGDRREHDIGSRDREVLAVVLADAEEVEPDLIGQHALGDDVADHLRLRQQGCRPHPRSRRRTCAGRAGDQASPPTNVGGRPI